MDSSCAININANPAARCQYCCPNCAELGIDPGEPSTTASTQNTMAGVALEFKNITAGTTGKYTLSEKTLKKAPGPSEREQRYEWTIKECLKKVTDCKNLSVSEIKELLADSYHPLIAESCTAAGIAAKTSELIQKAKETKSRGVCSTEISVCMVEAKHCLTDYSRCESDADFDRYFSECSIEKSGCDEYLADIRKSLSSDRNKMLAAAGEQLQKIVKAYQDRRKSKLNQIQMGCKDDSAKQRCINTVCANNLPNKCEGKTKSFEKTLAELLCKFYDTACSRLK